MAFEISELLESDIPDFVELELLANSAWPVAMAMEITAKKQGRSRKHMLMEWLEKAFEQKNPNGVWLKVTDTNSGRLIAVAAWTWQLEDTFVDRPPPTDDVQVNEVLLAMRAEWKEFRENFFKDVKWYHLQTIATHPEWQRRGAGSMLVKYGCDKADQAGVICTLTATAAGLDLYVKNGFAVVKEREFDLRPYGIDACEVRRWMVRKPVS